MTKHEFLTELKALLEKLPEAERRDILYDYEEHFQAGLADGQSEADIATSLGRPKTIAKELSADYYVTNAKENRSATNITRAIIAVVALGFFNLMFVLGPFVSIAAVIFSLYVTAVSIIIIPVVLLFRGIINGGGSILAGVFNMMTSVGLGVLMIIGLIYLTRWMYVLSLRYLQFNVSIARGDER